MPSNSFRQLAEEALHIRIQNASLSYKNNNIFSQINLDLAPASWTGLIGPSGVGKSTFLRLIAGLTTAEETFSGSICSEGAIAYMAQNDALLPWLTVLANVLISTKLRQQTKHEKQILKEKAFNLLQAVHLQDAIHLYPHQLSGGMRQRAALVRTLLEDRPIVLMDEPFSALDAVTRYQLQNLAGALLKNKTVLFITHDPAEALRLAHQVYLMHGQPANLKLIAELPTAIPREIDHDSLGQQTFIFQELLKVSKAI